MKEITFSTECRAAEVAKEMNPKFVRLENNLARGSSYYEWEFSSDSVVINHEQGHGNRHGRFANLFLVKGEAYKIGRDGSREFYNETVTVR